MCAVRALRIGLGVVLEFRRPASGCETPLSQYQMLGGRVDVVVGASLRWLDLMSLSTSSHEHLFDQSRGGER